MERHAVSAAYRRLDAAAALSASHWYAEA